MTRTRTPSYLSAILAATVCLAPLAAQAASTLQVSFGSGEIQQWVTSTGTDTDVPMTFRWWTTDPGTTGAVWDVEKASSTTPIATGVLTGAPTATKPAVFVISAGTFLTVKPPASPQAYTVHVTAVQGAAKGAPSAPVTITEAADTPVNFGNLNGPPPAPYIEPGHPTATLIAYRPIVYEAASNKWEGLVDLDFTNPGTTATDAVTVTVSDLKQVLQQNDTEVLVPSLAPGAHFRVAVGMRQFLLTSDVNTSNWAGRYAHGVSLLVGTAKINSPYVQDQQPPVLTGFTGTCVGDGCGAASPPWIANFRPNLPNIDMNIAAGQDFLYTLDYNIFDVFDKKARSRVDLSSTALSSNSAASQLAWENGSTATLFKDFWFPGSAHNVNPSILPNQAIPCNPNNPVIRSGNNLAQVNGFDASGCINDFYDSRLTYDVESKRFWIISHARNDFGTTTDCGTLSASVCNNAHAEATRLIMLAVSKSESPSAGFNTYIVENLYQDWPMMAEHGDYAFFFHHDPERVRVYDAELLASGVQKEFTPSFPASAFDNGVLRFPKHHNINANTTFALSSNGSTINVYALTGMHTRPTLLNKASYSDPNGDHFDTNYDNYQAAIRGQYIWIVTTDGSRVLVWRLPVGISANGKSVEIASSQVKRWTIQDTSGKGLNFDYGTIDVNANNDVVVSFRAWKTGTPDQVWYDVLYNSETNFRKAQALTTPATGGAGGRIDFVSAAVDPGDDETVWIIGRDATGAVVASVRP
jgi:hypothetical protein